MANQESKSLLTLFVRMYWMILGPMLIFLMAFAVVWVGGGWRTTADFGYLAAVLATMLARWFDFHLGHPETAKGKPATPRDLSRYVIGVGAIGLALWIVANLVGNYVLAN